MDDRRFDSITKALAKGTNRRSVLKGLLGLGGAALAGGAALDGNVEARRRPTPTPKPRKCPGGQHWDGSACVCPEGLSQCNPGNGPTCCNDQGEVGPGYSECCDNACCSYPNQCIDGDTCCPRLPEVGCLDKNGHCCKTLCEDVLDGVECCPHNAFCAGGAQSPGLCCSGDTPKRCDCGSDGNHCIPAGETCCTEDADCASLNSCDGLIWHHFTCGVGGYCVDTPVDCDDDKTCTTDSCHARTGCGHIVECNDPGVCETGPGVCDQQGNCAYPSLCSGDTPQCCPTDGGGYCIGAAQSCCAGNEDCSSPCEVCGQDGYCVTTCTTAETCCDDVCVDLQTDNDNCGACGFACSGCAVCSNGQCVAGTSCLSCQTCEIDSQTGAGSCDDACPGCATCTATDVNSTGSCQADNQNCASGDVCCPGGGSFTCEQGPYCGCDDNSDCAPCHNCNQGVCEAICDPTTQECCPERGEHGQCVSNQQGVGCCAPDDCPSTGPDGCLAGTCNANGECQYTPDNDLCTSGTACQDGTCSGAGVCTYTGDCSKDPETCCPGCLDCNGTACEPNNENCSATGLDGCLVGVCNGDGTCTYHPDDTRCDDGDPCTDAICSSEGVCSYPLDCTNDSDACCSGCLVCDDVTKQCVVNDERCSATGDDGCLVGICNGDGTCSYTPDNDHCDDCQVCSVQGVCAGSACLDCETCQTDPNTGASVCVDTVCMGCAECRVSDTNPNGSCEPTRTCLDCQFCRVIGTRGDCVDSCPGCSTCEPTGAGHGGQCTADNTKCDVEGEICCPDSGGFSCQEGPYCGECDYDYQCPSDTATCRMGHCDQGTCTYVQAPPGLFCGSCSECNDAGVCAQTCTETEICCDAGGGFSSCCTEDRCNQNTGVCCDAGYATCGPTCCKSDTEYCCNDACSTSPCCTADTDCPSCYQCNDGFCEPLCDEHLQQCCPDLGEHGHCIAYNESCSDAIDCTSDAQCSDLNTCDANQDWHHFVCDEALGYCVDSPVPCNDGNLCTVDGCDPVTGCTHTPITCADPPNTVCYELTGTCDSADGQCHYTPLAAGTSCGRCFTCDGNGACQPGCGSSRYCCTDELGESQCILNDTCCKDAQCTSDDDPQHCIAGTCFKENEAFFGRCGAGAPCEGQDPNTQCCPGATTADDGICVAPGSTCCTGDGPCPDSPDTCQQGVCQGGICALDGGCAVNTTCCGAGQCIDLQNDTENCGACGHGCAQGELCNGYGICVEGCLPIGNPCKDGYTCCDGGSCCDGTCVDAASACGGACCGIDQNCCGSYCVPKDATCCSGPSQCAGMGTCDGDLVWHNYSCPPALGYCVDEPTPCNGGDPCTHYMCGWDTGCSQEPIANCCRDTSECPQVGGSTATCTAEHVCEYTSNCPGCVDFWSDCTGQAGATNAECTECASVICCYDTQGAYHYPRWVPASNASSYYCE